MFFFLKSEIFLNGFTMQHLWKNPVAFDLFSKKFKDDSLILQKTNIFSFSKELWLVEILIFFSSKHKRVLSHCFSIKVVILKYKPCKGPKAYKTWPWCMCNSWWMKLRERKRRRKRNSWSLVLVWAKNYYKRFAIWTIDGVFSIC